MNSIDLETKIEGLKKAIAEHKDFTGTYESQLAKAEQELKDINKIALPPSVFDEIVDAIEQGINSFDFSDMDNFETEFSLDYDNRVQLDNLYLRNTNELGEMIMDKISEIFTEMEAPEDED